LKRKIYLSLVVIFILVLASGCSNTNNLSKRVKYGNLNIVQPDNWTQNTIDNTIIEISDGETMKKDKNWGLRELEEGTYIVRITNDEYFNYGTMVNIRENEVTEVVPDPNKFSEDEMVISEINSNEFQIKNEDGGTDSIIIKGVNLGLAKPNYFPGDVAIRESEYSRWFKMIGDMNANTIRVYTIQPPEFYEALYKHNKNSSNKIYVFHGAWIEEESLNDSSNIFDSNVTKEFDQEIKNIIDIIHGQAIIDKKIGHAGGIYKKDISQYVLGFIIGIEWDPYLVEEVNNKSKSQFKGNYFSTDNAKPFEIWLAERMDKAVEYERNKYDKQRSMSFTNWVTTDAITNKKEENEPEESQRIASINADHIKTKNDFKAGYFASYHAYPYYPEYINRKYSNDNYAEYLNELNNVHDLPILIAEFGVPSSRGKAHNSTLEGMDQGFLSEREQGEAIAKMFKDIDDEDLMGGLIFSWQDEYFKRTWNTKDYDIPERRPYWPDVQTNEQFFGLLSFDVQDYKGIYIDGEDDGWNLENPFYETEENNLFNKVYVDNDEESLYFRINYKNDIDFSEEETYILLDIKENIGQKEVLGYRFEEGIDFIIKLSGEDNSRILVSKDYDLFKYEYGDQLEKNEISSTIDGFNYWNLILSKGGKSGFDYYETGKLTYGNGNPDSYEYNSLSDFIIDDNVLEVRIPWALLNVKDPSQRKIMGDFMNKGLNSTVTTNGVKISLIGKAGDNSILLPKSYNDIKVYSWDRWNNVDYDERKKVSYEIVKDLFSGY